jgi:hypothetical protein
VARRSARRTTSASIAANAIGLRTTAICYAIGLIVLCATTFAALAGRRSRIRQPA